MAQDVARGEAGFDAHSIEQIPEADRDSTGWQQFWIWAGANIAPINWILGALGIVLGLGLTETILVIVIGNLVGCAIFASLTVMGHQTGVNQMVLSRSPFGRRGGYLSSWLQFLMTMGWIGVNTYFPVVLAVAILGHFGVNDSFGVKFIVVTVIMIIQVGIGVYGFYLIRSFEKYTVPVVFGIMGLMSILAWTRHGMRQLGPDLAPARRGPLLRHLRAGDRDRHRLGDLVGHLGLGLLRFVRPTVSSRSVFWYSYAGLFVPTVWLAVLGASIASVTQSADPAKLVSSVFGGVVAVLVMLLVLHGPIATNILNVYSSALAGPVGRHQAPRRVLGLIAGVVGYAVTLYFVYSPDFAVNFDNWMVSLVLWMSPWVGVVLADYYLLRRKQIDVAQLYADPKASIYGDVNWVGIGAFLLGLVCGWLFLFGLVGPLQGYVSGTSCSGGDLSWLVGIVVAGGVYLIGMRGKVAATPARELTGAAGQPKA